MATTTPSPSIQPLTRRRLLAVAAAAAVPAAMGSRIALAECREVDTMTVWRLAADWGYPRGPNGKTRLVSRASRRAAAHRYALTERDALDMNLHLCSFAPAFAVEVRRDEFMVLWDELAYRWSNPWLGRSVTVLDDRHVSRVAGGQERLARALSPVAPSNGSCPDDIDGAVAPASGVLPFTGFAGLGAPALGTGLLVAGMIAVRRARGVVPPPRRPAPALRGRRRGRHLRH